MMTILFQRLPKGGRAMREIAVIMQKRDEQLCAALSAEYTVCGGNPESWENTAAILVDIDRMKEQGLVKNQKKGTYRVYRPGED